MRPTDGPAKVYRARCELFIVDPPAPDWDGLTIMREK
jgi:hypothetical protein